MHADFGTTMWALGARTTQHTLAGVRWVSITEYDAFREVTGFVDVGEILCLTVRTEQTQTELHRLLRNPAS